MCVNRALAVGSSSSSRSGNKWFGVINSQRRTTRTHSSNITLDRCVLGWANTGQLSGRRAISVCVSVDCGLGAADTLRFQRDTEPEQMNAAMHRECCIRALSTVHQLIDCKPLHKQIEQFCFSTSVLCVAILAVGNLVFHNSVECDLITIDCLIGTETNIDWKFFSAFWAHTNEHK